MADLEQRLAVLGPHVHDGVPLSLAAAAAGVPARTARRWRAAYEAEGSDGLVRAARADRGGRRMPAELVALIEGMALRRPPPRAAEVHRAVTAIAAEKGWPAPSYPVVRRIIAGLDRGLVTLAHHGPAVYRDGFELVWRRESAHPNDLWQADHTELDVMIMDETGKPARPWLTVIEDDHSRAVAGYTVFLGAPSSLQTALALRQAVWRKSDPAWPVCGLPAVLYSDHGADFTSSHLTQVCADVRVQLIHSTPGVPRGRGKIERIFGTITTELLPTLPGHIPPGNHGKPVTPPTLRLSELDAMVGRYLVDTYHHRVHPETGQTPARRWVAGGWLPRMPESEEALDLLLLTVATPRKVHRDGIRCHGLRYLSLTLAAYVGEQVTIRYDPRDLAEIRVFHQGAFLCRAVSPELAATSISLKDLQAARNRRRRELRRELTSRRSLVDMLTHPVPEPVPDGAATLARPEQSPLDTGTPPATRLKIYRED
ncbi:MAG TPA: Mu transposase C-terminal domain-containing protein [Nakamurella sp.]|nr:Mu transposase C-terminal domain-containing protein [Nakamurella sp.]